MTDIKIERDCEPLNPRAEWDQIGRMVCFHRHYNLGDEHEYNADDYESWDDIGNALIADGAHPDLIMSLYLYDHSGIAISTSPFRCRRDSGQVGFIYMTKADAVANWGKKLFTAKVKEKARACLEAEVKVYDQYLRGAVYGYVLTAEDGEKDSCWGFFGDTIEETGLLDCIPKELHAQAVLAFERA